MSDRLVNDDDLRLFFLMHRAIRSDLHAFAGAVARLGAGDLPRIEALDRWLSFIESTVRKHHEAEDHWVYPTLASREPAFAEAHAKLEADHQRLDPELAAMRDALKALATCAAFEAERDALAARAGAFRDLMREHLDDEEAAILPLMKLHIRKSEIEAFEHDNAKQASLREMSIVLPWIVEFADEHERALVDAILPLPAKLLYRWWWKSRYERFVAPLREGLAGGVA